MLTEEGYEVVGQAGDGATAVELTTELQPDLLAMDVKMPKLDGTSAAEQSPLLDRPRGDADGVQRSEELVDRASEGWCDGVRG